MLRVLALVALTGSAAIAETCPDHATAYKAATDHVMFQLKSPFSAEFPDIDAEYVSVELIGSCEFSVSGFVDASNSLGRVVRQGFSVQMAYADGDWSASGLVAR